MSSYLVVKNSTNTLSYPCKTTHTGNPYLKVDTGYLDLTTETTTGTHVVVKSGESNYRLRKTTTSTQDTSYIASYYSYRSYETTSSYISEPTGTSFMNYLYCDNETTRFTYTGNTWQSTSVFYGSDWETTSQMVCSGIAGSYVISSASSNNSYRYCTDMSINTPEAVMNNFLSGTWTDTTSKLMVCNLVISYIQGRYITITSNDLRTTYTLYNGKRNYSITHSITNSTYHKLTIYSYSADNRTINVTLSQNVKVGTNTTGYYVSKYCFTGGNTITTTNSLQTTYGSLLYRGYNSGSVSSWTNTQSTDTRQGVTRYSSTTENITRESTYMTEY